MAEIKTKDKKPMWAWIFLLLIMLTVIVYFNNSKPTTDTIDMDFDDDVTSIQTNDLQNENATRASGITAGAIYNNFRAFDESIRDSTRIAVDSSYTKVAFSNLTKLVVKHANNNAVEDSEELDDLRSFSVLITSIAGTNGDVENFKNFKTACDKIASVLEDIQEKSYPALKSDVSSLEQLASKVSISIPMDQQQVALNNFLRKSRDILKVMSENN